MNVLELTAVLSLGVWSKSHYRPRPPGFRSHLPPIARALVPGMQWSDVRLISICRPLALLAICARHKHPPLDVIWYGYTAAVQLLGWICERTEAASQQCVHNSPRWIREVTLGHSLLEVMSY